MWLFQLVFEKNLDIKGSSQFFKILDLTTVKLNPLSLSGVAEPLSVISILSLRSQLI